MDSSIPSKTYTSKELELATVLAAVREGLIACEDLDALAHEVRSGRSDTLLSAVTMSYGLGASDIDRLELKAEDFLGVVSPIQHEAELSLSSDIPQSDLGFGAQGSPNEIVQNGNASSAASTVEISERERQFYESVRPSRTTTLEDLPPEAAAPRFGLLSDLMSHVHYVDDIFRSYTAGFIGLFGFLILAAAASYGGYYVSNNFEALFGPDEPVAAPHLMPPPTIAGEISENPSEVGTTIDEEPTVPGSRKSVSAESIAKDNEDESDPLAESESRQKLEEQVEPTPEAKPSPLADIEAAIKAVDYSLAQLRIEDLLNDPTRSLSQEQEEILTSTKVALLIANDNTISRRDAFEIIDSAARINDENIDRQLVTSYWLLTSKKEERLEATKKLGIVLPDTSQTMLWFQTINKALSEDQVAALKRLSDQETKNPLPAFYYAVARYYGNDNKTCKKECKQLLKKHEELMQQLVGDDEATYSQQWLRRKVQRRFELLVNSLRGKLDAPLEQ